MVLRSRVACEAAKPGVHDPYVIDVVIRERLKVILSLKFGVEPFDKSDGKMGFRLMPKAPARDLKQCGGGLLAGRGR